MVGGVLIQMVRYGQTRSYLQIRDQPRKTKGNAAYNHSLWHDWPPSALVTHTHTAGKLPGPWPTTSTVHTQRGIQFGAILLPNFPVGTHSGALRGHTGRIELWYPYTNTPGQLAQLGPVPTASAQRGNGITLSAQKHSTQTTSWVYRPKRPQSLVVIVQCRVAIYAHLKITSRETRLKTEVLQRTRGISLGVDVHNSWMI